MKHFSRIGLTALCATALPLSVFAQGNSNGNGNGAASNSCSSLPSQSALKTALTTAVNAEGAGSGLNFNMWATIVDRDGIVCAVAFTGDDRGAQWPGSRVISAQKANTANSFSLDGLALSTANLYAPVQPGGSLFGLQESNPVDTSVAYKGPSKNFGQKNDPMVGEKIGGINVFGGGLGLYDPSSKVVGGLGVSGDTSCEDHTVAWRVRKLLGLDFLHGKGVSGNADYPDNIIYNLGNAFGHPNCPVPSTDPSTVPALAVQ
jgi:uncharacterized protein GlcG (DUF336 family)